MSVGSTVTDGVDADTPAERHGPPEGVVVRAYMAHHQGMTLVALANALLDDRMVERFHAEPRIQATELLLQERVPRHVGAIEPRPLDEVRVAAPGALVMHCLPTYREKEITDEVFEEHARTIFDQAENRLHAQKAVLSLLANSEAALR